MTPIIITIYKETKIDIDLFNWHVWPLVKSEYLGKSNRDFIKVTSQEVAEVTGEEDNPAEVSRFSRMEKHVKWLCFTLRFKGHFLNGWGKKFPSGHGQ